MFTLRILNKTVKSSIIMPSHSLPLSFFLIINFYLLPYIQRKILIHFCWHVESGGSWIIMVYQIPKAGRRVVHRGQLAWRVVMCWHPPQDVNPFCTGHFIVVFSLLAGRRVDRVLRSLNMREPVMREHSTNGTCVEWKDTTRCNPIR